MLEKRKHLTSSARTLATDETMRPWLAIAHTYHLCDALMERRLGALGVRTAEHEILANLLREPGIAQQTLARRCLNAKSHISALLTVMESRGWVVRKADAVDARVKQLFLTPAGEQLAGTTLAVQAAIAGSMSEALSPKALADVSKAMRLISDRLLAMLEQEGQTF